MKEMTDILTTAESLDAQGKFAEADELMQKAAFTLNPLKWFKKKQQPQQQPASNRSKVHPLIEAPAIKFSQRMSAFQRSLQTFIAKESEKLSSMNGRTRDRAQAKVELLQKMEANAKHNFTKAIELANRFISYQLQNKKEITAYNYKNEELQSIGLNRYDRSFTQFQNDFQEVIKKWQSKFLKPIFDEFFIEVNDIGKTIAPTSKSITSRDPEQIFNQSQHQLAREEEPVQFGNQGHLSKEEGPLKF